MEAIFKALIAGNFPASQNVLKTKGKPKERGKYIERQNKSLQVNPNKKVAAKVFEEILSTLPLAKPIILTPDIFYKKTNYNNPVRQFPSPC